MSTGSVAIPLLKAAPEQEQLADRLTGGQWAGLELCLSPHDVGSDEAVERAVSVVRTITPDLLPDRGGSAEGRPFALTAEAPVAWPSGAFVRVDRLDQEAMAGIERSASFAAAIGSPVLTIHLFVPLDAASFRDDAGVDEDEVERFLRFYATACGKRGVTPLIENVPPVLRMRTGGAYFSPIGGHWRDMLAWRERVPKLRFTLDTSHAALFRSFCAAYPTLFGLDSDEGLELERYVEEMGAACEVAHVSNAHGVLAEGLPYDSGELDLDPIVRRLGGHARFIVAEVNEPDPRSSHAMKAGYRAIERALAKSEPPTSPRSSLPEQPTSPQSFRPEQPSSPRSSRSSRLREERNGSLWQGVLGRRDPVPSQLALQERFGGRRVLITGSGGSIGRALATLLDGFRPEQITMLDGHEPSLIADRRGRDGAMHERFSHVLCDVRDRGRLEAEVARAQPDAIFHLAAYKHVDWAEVFPEEFVDTNLHGSWNVLATADAAGVDTVVVASTDKAALAASFYGRTKRFMEQLTAFSTRRGGAQRLAVRFVNVLGSAGSASELFLRQARANVPLTVTDTGMVRYWITMAHATTLAAHGALLAADGAVLAAPAEPPRLTVGELAERIWRGAGHEDAPELDLVGIRRGETLSEVITAPAETLGAEAYQGIAPIEGEIPTAGPAWVAERLTGRDNREQARAVWLEAMRRPGLLTPAETSRI